MGQLNYDLTEKTLHWEKHCDARNKANHFNQQQAN